MNTSTIMKTEIGRIVRHAAAPLVTYAIARGVPADGANWALEGLVLGVTYGVVLFTSWARDRRR